MTQLATKSHDGGTCCRSVDAELLLLSRCLDGDEAAWKQFFSNRTPEVTRLVRHFLHRLGAKENAHDVDDIVAEVWHTLVRDNARVLRRFDPNRSRRIGTYLAGVVSRVVSNYCRCEQRRRNRVLLHDLDAELECPCRSGTDTALMMIEFVETLAPKEVAFLSGYLLAVRPPNGDADEPLSPANVRQRRHRLRVKLKTFLCGGETERAAEDARNEGPPPEGDRAPDGALRPTEADFRKNGRRLSQNGHRKPTQK